MQTYTYMEESYSNIYDLAEALAKKGVFIPLSLTEAELKELGVIVAEAEEPIENIRARKIIELKRQRDTAEVEPVEYGGHLYDYDSKARDRISAAIIALDVQTAQAKATASIDWTTADNKDVKVTADDLRCVIASVAQRSNLLHVAYRTAKAQVEAAGTADEVRAVCME